MRQIKIVRRNGDQLPDPTASGSYHVELVSELAAILCLAECQVCPEQANMRKPRRLAGADGGSVSVVAGTGFEHYFAISNVIIPPTPVTKVQ